MFRVIDILIHEMNNINRNEIHRMLFKIKIWRHSSDSGYRQMLIDIEDNFQETIAHWIHVHVSLSIKRYADIVIKYAKRSLLGWYYVNDLQLQTVINYKAKGAYLISRALPFHHIPAKIFNLAYVTFIITKPFKKISKNREF